MLFTEGRFFILFLVCFSVYWSLKQDRARRVWIALCSAVFYGAWDWRFLVLMYFTVTVDFWAGVILGREEHPHRRKIWLVLSLISNLGILGFFKYFNFFVDSAVHFSAWLGLPLSARELDIVLPVGVSFYTFQSLSYTIDVYRREIRPAKSFLDFAMFVTFFPQLVAGPIVRASHFLPQLVEKRQWKDVDVRGAVWLFLIGFVKKACVADQVSGAVDAVFKAPDAFVPTAHWIATVLYAVQIYCDFSGYSDMAIATAALLGYRLTQNFDFPYLARDITTFWRRWHMSLSTWFRDYVYIPLGGNRISPSRTYVNLLIVFFLCGLWHGAKWTFVAWGLMHGIFLIAHRVWKGSVAEESKLGRAGASLGWVLTPLAWLFAWVVFRAKNFEDAVTVWKGMLFFTEETGPGYLSLAWIPIIAVLFLMHVAAARELYARPLRAPRDWVFAVGYGVAWALVLPWASGFKPFIYFQF